MRSGAFWAITQGVVVNYWPLLEGSDCPKMCKKLTSTRHVISTKNAVLRYTQDVSFFMQVDTLKAFDISKLIQTDRCCLCAKYVQIFTEPNIVYL